MTDLVAELRDAEDRAAQLRLAIRQGPCREHGHDWQFLGGRNAGCADRCGCSVPVNHCAKCGDCDYGDNDEAQAIVRACEQERADG